MVKEIKKIHASGRPILVGTSSVRASETLADMLREQGLTPRVLNAVRLADESHIISLAGEGSMVTIATNMAGRGTDIKLAIGVADWGGLHVIATEWQESGRVDRQLFGRSGRQGDPGTAQLFASLEDSLAKRFMPSASRKGLAFLSRISGPISGWFFQRSFRAGQGRAERLAEKQRQAVLAADLWLDEALSFTSG